METQYFALVDGKEIGPFSPKAIRLLLQGADRHVLIRFGESGWIAPEEMDWDALEPAEIVKQPIEPIIAAEPPTSQDPAATLVFGSTKRKKKSNALPFGILLFLFGMAGVFVWGKIEKDAEAAANNSGQDNSTTVLEHTVERRKWKPGNQGATMTFEEPRRQDIDLSCEDFWSGGLLDAPSNAGCRDFYDKTKGLISIQCRQLDQFKLARSQVHPAAAGHYDEMIFNAEQELDGYIVRYHQVASVNRCS